MRGLICPRCKGDLSTDDVFCGSCGSYTGKYTDNEPSSSAPSTDNEPSFSAPSIGDIFLTATVTASILPFVQSIATEAGKDVYSKLKKRIAKVHEPSKNTGKKAVVVFDPRRNLLLSVNESISSAGAQELFRLDLALPIIRDGEIHWVQEAGSSDGSWWFHGRMHI